ncbi:MAG: (Fe-S)-binding protein [Bacilli bacterium]
MVYGLVLLAGIGAILGLGLAIATKVFHVEADKRIITVNDMLPGYNCGACGCPGCMGMAEKVVANEINLKACKPGKEEAFLEIQKYLKETPGPDGEVVEVKL